MLYPRITELPEDYLGRKIEEYLKEDAPEGDYTSASTIHPQSWSKAALQAQQGLILAGVPVIKKMFEGEDFELNIMKKDGSLVHSGETIAEIEGPSEDILTRERVLLNILQRLCGIAMLTQEYVRIAEPYGTKILDTRKTTPGLRLFEKYAVAMGGGWNHRLDLSSGILIKDNHIKAAGGIFQAIDGIQRNLTKKLPIELEVENLQQIKEGMEAEVDGFLLDNMTPAQVSEALELIEKFSPGREIFVEASGGITLDTLEDYAKTGVEAISTGALTHSYKSAEMHLEFVE